MVNAKSVRLRKISLGNLRRCKQVGGGRKHWPTPTDSIISSAETHAFAHHWQPEDTEFIEQDKLKFLTWIKLNKIYFCGILDNVFTPNLMCCDQNIAIMLLT